MVLIRLATVEDIEQLTQMRWDYSEEEKRPNSSTYEEFYQVCRSFLLNALTSGNWFIWVAETEGVIVSHMYLQIIHKVPRPGQSPDPYFGYVTNVYTRPGYRSQGIGSSMQTAIEEWSKQNDVEFLIVWPSQKSVPFYAANGYARCEEAMEKFW